MSDKKDFTNPSNISLNILVYSIIKSTIKTIWMCIATKTMNLCILESIYSSKDYYTWKCLVPMYRTCDISLIHRYADYFALFTW